MYTAISIGSFINASRHPLKSNARDRGPALRVIFVRSPRGQYKIDDLYSIMSTYNKFFSLSYRNVFLRIYLKKKKKFNLYSNQFIFTNPIRYTFLSGRLLDFTSRFLKRTRHSHSLCSLNRLIIYEIYVHHKFIVLILSRVN